MEWHKRLIIYILTSEEDQMAPIKIIIAYSSLERLVEFNVHEKLDYLPFLIQSILIINCHYYSSTR